MESADVFVHWSPSRLALLAGLALASIAVAGPARADDSAAVPEAAPSASGLEEVVVTAQRRRENLQDVPIAVSAFPAEQLEAAGVTSVQDLDILTPGLEYGQQGGYGQPHLRGVGTIANGPGVENPIALYVDGVYYGSMSGSVLTLNNIASVEIDKGPQGTLFGRNATGGLIQITTKDPTQDIQGMASAGYGDYSTTTADFYLTGGIAPNLAADIAVDFSDQGEGYGKNYFTDQAVNKTQDLAVRSKWLYTPVAGSEFKLIFDYEQTDYSPVYLPAPGTTPLGGPAYTGPTQGVDGYYQPYGMIHQGGVSLRYTQDLDFAQFISTTAFRQTAMDISFDGSLVPNFAYALNIEIIETHRQWTQEFQLVSPVDSKLKWATGIFLYTNDSQYNPISVTGGLVAPYTLANTYSDQKSFSAAGYAQASYEVLPALDLTAGLRYTYERRNFHDASTLALPGTGEFGIGQDEEREIFQKPTWRLALDYRFTPDLMGYVSYNRGFKSGGFNDDLEPTTRYAPEVLDAYEIGLKSDILDRKVRIDLAGFYYDYKNIQAVRYPNGLEDIYNGAAAEIYGLDLDAKAALAENLTVTAGLEILHDAYTSFPTADYSIEVPGGGTEFQTFDATGNRLSLAPDWTFNLAANYVVPTEMGDYTFNLSYAYNDGWYAEPDNRLHQGPYSLLNAQAEWDSPDTNYSIRLWCKNMTDEAYLTALDSQANGDYAIYAPPRTFGVTGTYRF
jgi:iron complex outermembrane receptor protein